MYNATQSMSVVASIHPFVGWIITIAIFFSVFLIIFFLSKNIRQFIYGAVVSIVLILVYKFSRWVGTSTVKNNFKPIKWFGYISGFIILSIIIGNFLLKIDWIKKFEKKLR
jgi:hypothetical protein